VTLSILLAATATTATTAGAASAAGSRACALARVLAHGALHPAHAVGSPGGTLFIGFDPTLQHRPGAAAAATDVSVAESFSRGSSLCAPLGGAGISGTLRGTASGRAGLAVAYGAFIAMRCFGAKRSAAFARLPKERPMAASNAMPVLLVCALFICLSLVHLGYTAVPGWARSSGMPRVVAMGSGK
jgi:hypothetical protein